jgi:hypothetical protein
MVEEDEDESPHVNTDETAEEAQDTCPAFDDGLDSEVDNFTIEEDDRVFMTMVHPVNPHHFVRASSIVSGRLAEVFAKNSKLKGFEDIVPTSLHAYADVFSETAFDSLPERRKWDHAIKLEHEPSPGFRKVYPMTLTEQTEMYITPPSKCGITTREDRQEVARSTLVNRMELKMATLIWRAAPGCLRWNCAIFDFACSCVCSSH